MGGPSKQLPPQGTSYRSSCYCERGLVQLCPSCAPFAAGAEWIIIMYNSEVWHEREGDNGEGDPRALLEGGPLTRMRPPTWDLLI